jgi:hypothetical protein
VKVFDPRRYWDDRHQETSGLEGAGYAGMGLASFICASAFMLLVVLGALVGSSSQALGALLIVQGLAGLVAVGTLFGLMNAIWRTALYHYATSGAVPDGFEPSVMSSAFVAR